MLTRQRQQVGVLGPFSLGVTVALLIPALGRTSGGECRTIGDVVYRMYSPGEMITLGPCPCSCKHYVWEKKRTDRIPRWFHSQRELRLTVAAELGAVYCCKCRTQGYPYKQYHYQQSCCYGVAVQPRVDFRIEQLGKQTTTVHTNVSVVLYCNVTGYPFPSMRRHGPVDVFQTKSEMKLNDTNPYYARSPWYSVYKVDVPPEMVTRNFSGNYSCTGEVNVFQDGITDDVSTVVLMVTAYADPGVVVRCQKPPVERNLTLVCTVDSPEPYTVMWLCDGVNISEADEKYHTFHNQSDHFLVVRAASQRDWGKKYACVVTTDLSQTKRELQCSLDSKPFDGGLPGHHGPSNPVSVPGLVVFALIGLLAVVAIAVVVYKCKRQESPRRTDGDPLVFPSTKELGQGDLRRRTHS